MLVEVTKLVWKETIGNQTVSIFDEPEYLETISDLYGTQLSYWVIYKKNKAVMGFATHSKNGSIIVPNHYSYSSFWFDERILGDYSFFEHLEKAISVLKKEYRYISFRLPPHVKDIRAFNLHGFSSRVNYTYLNYLHNSFKYRSNTEIKLKASFKQDFVFSNHHNYNEVLKQQIQDFKYFGYNKSQEKFYTSYFKTLIEKGFLESFTVYKKNNQIASALILIDKNHLKAYNLLMSVSKTNYSGEASTFLYHNILSYFKEHNFNFVDLYGADMKGIANYKSGFKGSLENHYTVSFGLFNRFLMPKIAEIKKNIKSFLDRFFYFKQSMKLFKVNTTN